MRNDPLDFQESHTFGYAVGNPLLAIDPTGLETYVCTRRLDYVPFRFGDLYHEYVCTGNEKSGRSCGGLGPSGNPLNSPGRIENDRYDAKACTKRDNDNKCIEDCVQDKLRSPPPNYSANLSKGQNCQTYAEYSVVAHCEAQCGGPK